MLKYSSVVGAIYEYKNKFPTKNGASKISSDDLDVDYILLDDSSYIDKSSLSKRRNDKPTHPGIKDDYRNADAAAKLIEKYKRSGKLNERLDEKSKAAIINELRQLVATDSEIDERSKYFIDCLAKTETFPEFFAACLILSITEEPLQDFWKDLSSTRSRSQVRTADLISLTPDLVFFNEIIGRDDLIEDILFGLNTKNRHIQLTSMGGIGKTEVLRAAYSYLMQHSNEHSFDYNFIQCCLMRGRPYCRTPMKFRGDTNVKRAFVRFFRQDMLLLTQGKIIVHSPLEVRNQFIDGLSFIRNQRLHALNLSKKQPILGRKLHTADIAFILHRITHSNPSFSSASTN